MGCDIHLFIEAKIDGKWQCLPNQNEWEGMKSVNEIFGDRNYTVFALLAGVRNSDRIIPISKPRGIPSDVSETMRAKIKEWDADGHSHSYFDLAELQRASANIQINHPKKHIDALVSIGEYYQSKIEGRYPEMYCRGNPGEIVTEKEAQALRTKYGNVHAGFGSNAPYVRYRWAESIYESVKWFFIPVVGFLSWLCEAPEIENTRIVFFFDN